MKKNKILLAFLIIACMATLTGCQDNYKINVYRGATKDALSIYYDEKNYTVKDYEWNGTDLIIHFKENK